MWRPHPSGHAGDSHQSGGIGGGDCSIRSGQGFASLMGDAVRRRSIEQGRYHADFGDENIYLRMNATCCGRLKLGYPEAVGNLN